MIGDVATCMLGGSSNKQKRCMDYERVNYVYLLKLRVSFVTFILAHLKQQKYSRNLQVTLKVEYRLSC